MIGSIQKAKFPNYNFSTTTTKLYNQVRMADEEFKKVGLSKEQSKFEKEDVEKVEGGRYGKTEGK